MNILLIQIPHLYEGTDRSPMDFPLGLGSLAAVLKKEHQVKVLDLWLNFLPAPEAVKHIQADPPDLIGLSVYSTQFPYFRELTSLLRETFPSLPLIAGGPGATFSAEIFLRHTPVDVCVLSEGEATFPDLLQNLDKPENVAGIAFLQDGEVVFTPPRKPIRSLDDIPLPDRSVTDQRRYMLNAARIMQPFFHGEPVATLVAGRGCPYRCTYCSRTFSGCRLRSPANIKEELLQLRDQYGAKAVIFEDELVLMGKQRTLALCDMIGPLGMKWGCQGRINSVDREILKAMKAAGCVYVGYGVESYTQRILDAMNKQIRVEDIIPAIEMTKEQGLEPLIQYMFAFPGENEESIANTIRFFRTIGSKYYGSYTTPIPGTELYDQARAQGLIPDEKEYLERLVIGYNTTRPLVNMTDFSDDELIEKQQLISRAVNRRYYRKHPAEFLQHLWSIWVYRFRLLATSPTLFWEKLRRVILGR